MAIKPKKQMPANKGETGGGVRGASTGRGKLKVDKGAAKSNEKIKTEVIQSRSVRVKPGTKSNSMADAQRKSANAIATNTAAERKSGKMAETTAARVMTGKPKTTVKINSAPKKKGK